MDEKKILDEFRKLVDSKKQEIMEMQYMYLLKKAENEIVQEQFREVDNKILAEYPFYAYYDCERSKSKKRIYKGERILSSEDQWCMSTEAYDRFLEICRKEFFSAGLTDEEGKYTEETNTENQLKDIKDKLIRLSVEILPDDFPNRKMLEDAIKYEGYNWFRIREKLFELIMQLR